MRGSLPRPSREDLLARAGFVRGLARVLVHDEDQAEDLVQDTYLTAFRSPPRQATSLRGWLSTVLRNLVRMRVRAEGRRRARERAVSPPDAAPSAAEVAARLELQRNLVDVVSQLSEPYRTAVLLRFFDGLEASEIARRLGVPPKTVQTRLRRALGMLRARLDEMHDGSRESWRLALLPLAVLARRPAGTAAGISAALLGGLIVSAKLKLVVAVVVLAIVGVALWQGFSETPNAPPGPEVAATDREVTRLPDRPPVSSPAEAIEKTVPPATPPPAPDPEDVPTVPEAGRPEWRLVVTVKDYRGRPAAGVLLVFENEQKDRYEGFTDADGRATLEVTGRGDLQSSRGTEIWGRRELKRPPSGELSIQVFLGPPDPFVLPGQPPATIAGGRGGVFGGRGGHRNLKAHGGGAATESAVDLGLYWLNNHQASNGSWDADGFASRCQLNACGDPGHPECDVAVTGLTLLAFLGAGETHRHGRYKLTITRALTYLLDNQNEEGSFGASGELGIYGHAIATLAVEEAWALTQAGKLEESAQAAVDFLGTVKLDEANTSITAWVVSALSSAKAAGLRVDAALLDRVQKRLEDAIDPRTGEVRSGGEEQAPFPPDTSDALVAASLFGRGRLDLLAAGTPSFQAGLLRLNQALPTWGEDGAHVDLAYWYFGALAMLLDGGEGWKPWNDALKTAVVKHQRKDGDEKGSWDPRGPHGRTLGRVGTTALLAMCMEVYYRYSRPFRVERR